MPIDRGIRHAVGDRVVLHPEEYGGGVFKHGVVYVVKYSGVGYIRLKDYPQGKFHWRFLPAEVKPAPAKEEVKPLQAGDKVVLDEKCPLNKHDVLGLARGVTYTIKSGKQFLTLVELPGVRFKATRFKRYVAPPVLTIDNVKVGDMVKIVAKVERAGGRECFWNSQGDMDRYLNDGVAYPVHHVGHNTIRVSFPKGDHWHFLPECLAFAEYLEPAKKEEPKEVVLPDLREVLTAEVKKKGQNTICSYGTLFSDGTINKQVNDVCHARLAWKPYHMKNPNAKPVAAALILCGSDKILRHRISAENVPQYLEAYKKYLHYLFNESPWAQTYITKDVEEAFEKGVLMNIDVHRNWVFGGAVATREGVEFPQRLPVFQKVLELGFSGNVAYLCGMYLTGSFNKETYSTGNCGGGHQVLSGHYEWEGIKKFFAKGYAPNPEFKSFREQLGGYYIAKACVEGHMPGKHIEQYYHEAKVAEKMTTIFAANCPEHVEGEGFGANAVINVESLKTLATFIHNELEGAK